MMTDRSAGHAARTLDSYVLELSVRLCGRLFCLFTTLPLSHPLITNLSALLITPSHSDDDCDSAVIAGRSVPTLDNLPSVL